MPSWFSSMPRPGASGMGSMPSASRTNGVVTMSSICGAGVMYSTQRALGSATVAVTDWAASPVSGGAGSLGVEASGVYRVGGYGRNQGRTVPWSLILKVAASSAHGGDPDGGARERHAYRSGLLGDLPGGLVAPRCLGAVAQPDGALWTWLEEIRESDGPHWRLARYGLAARHLCTLAPSWHSVVSRPRLVC